jgi:hypothetical protein
MGKIRERRTRLKECMDRHGKKLEKPVSEINDEMREIARP